MPTCVKCKKDFEKIKTKNNMIIIICIECAAKSLYDSLNEEDQKHLTKSLESFFDLLEEALNEPKWN